jgi:hypothetical protein
MGLMRIAHIIIIVLFATVLTSMGGCMAWQKKHDEVQIQLGLCEDIILRERHEIPLQMP